MTSQEIPSFVIEAANALIAERIRNSYASFTLAALAARASSISGIAETEMDMRWFDIEDLFRAAGWIVNYDQPAYCESFPATFTFRAPQ